MTPSRLRLREHAPDELAHYAKKAIDVEYRIVPNRIVLPAAATALVAHTLIDPSLEWTIAALGAAGFLLVAAWHLGERRNRHVGPPVEWDGQSFGAALANSLPTSRVG